MTQEQQLAKNIIEEFTNILKFLETKTTEEINSAQIPEEMNELMKKLSSSFGQLDSINEQLNSIVEQVNAENEQLQEELAQAGILPQDQIKECFSSGNHRSIEDDELETAAAKLKQEISQIADRMNITLDNSVIPVKSAKNETSDKKSNKRRERTLKKRLDLL